jgi:hypothetical protein
MTIMRTTLEITACAIVGIWALVAFVFVCAGVDPDLAYRLGKGAALVSMPIAVVSGVMVGFLRRGGKGGE